MSSSGRSGLATLFGWRGRKPEVPEFTPVDTTEEQAATIAGNLKNLPELSKLGEQTNLALVDQFTNALEKIIPGYKDILKKGTENLASEMRGELPADVQNQIARKAAEMGVVTGTSGSDFDKYRQVRNLGLTSLDVTNRALDSATRWIDAAARRVPQFNFASMYISPAQRIATQQWNRAMQWNRDWLGNQIDALPSNEEQAYAQMLDYVADWATVASSYGTGSMMGGGGGMGGAGAGAGAGASPGYNYGGGGYGYNSAAGLAAGESALGGY